MILGMSLEAFTTFHVIISLVALLAGAAMLIALLQGKDMPAVTGVFLIFTVLTSATGFLFPASQILPSHVVGGISLGVLIAAIVAYYVARLAGLWRWIYIVSALSALYFNTFVAVVQAFQKISALNALAPTGSEPPFLVVQILVLAAFIFFGVIAVRRFHPATQIT